MNVIIISIGDELLSGNTMDTNAHYLTQKLVKLGYSVIRRYTVPDEQQTITKKLRESIPVAKLIITTGGLGPTDDDRTHKALADLLNEPLTYSSSYYNHIKKTLEGYTLLTEKHERQASVPQSSTLINNNIGTALGLLIRKDRCRIYSLPGVPEEMKDMFEKEVEPVISDLIQPHTFYRSIDTAAIAETEIADHIERLDLPSEVEITYLPSLLEVRVRLKINATDKETAKKILDNSEEKIRSVLEEHIYSSKEETLPKVLGNLLKEKELTIATAESFTGGRISEKITTIPGAADYFIGAVTCYNNIIKYKLLNVNPETIEKEGAVSEPVAIQMVEGICELMGTDIGIASTGLAGPGKGDEDKPVGTMWIAVGSPGKVVARLIKGDDNRTANIKRGTTFALYSALNYIREK